MRSQEIIVVITTTYGERSTHCVKGSLRDFVIAIHDDLEEKSKINIGQCKWSSKIIERIDFIASNGEKCALQKINNNDFEKRKIIC